MKKAFLTTAILVAVVTAKAQSSIDLSKDPAKPAPALNKSNAALLRESQPATPAQPQDPATQYPADAANTGTISGRTVAAPAGTPQVVNSTTNQYQIGNGVKANNTMQYDDAGKIRSSGTSIEFGKKKK